MQIIIYNDENGQMRRIRPAENFVNTYGIDMVAKKDTPNGLPYKIIQTSELPDKWAERGAWEVDNSELTDGVGWPVGAGTDWVVIGYLSATILLVEERSFNANGELQVLDKKIFNTETESFEEI